MILVMGGTGKTGRRVVANLREAGHEPRVASRSSAIHFDWDVPSTWAAALDGVESVYLVDSQAADAATSVRAFAKQAAGRHLVFLSARVWQDFGDEWLATERAVQQAGTEWTILRPTWFNQNFTEDPIIADAITAGELRLPTGGGVEPFIDAEDIAAVAARVLTEPGHAGRIYELSGPRLLTWGEAVAEIAAATGRDIRFTPITDAEFRSEMTSRGYADDTEIMSVLFEHIKDGRSAALSDGVQQVLGREPVDFEVYARGLAD